MTAQWDDDVHHALHVALTGEAHGYYADFAGGGAREEAGPIGVLAKVLTRGFLHDGTMSTFRGRPWGAPVDIERLDARRLLGYLQTHDQVGNRMAGDRISGALPPGAQAAGAALYLLGPTTPMIFMGEEWAASTPWQFFTSFDDEVLADAVRRGRRAEFGAHGWSQDAVPDPQDPATRDASVLDWDEAHAGHHGRMLQWYAACTGLRRDCANHRRLADTCHVHCKGLARTARPIAHSDCDGCCSGLVGYGSNRRRNVRPDRDDRDVLERNHQLRHAIGIGVADDAD